MEERKTFTFNGVNSADYGLYISGDYVYNAPSRVYEMVDIAGRNGQLAIDQGRFENIEVTYPAFIFAETQTEFAQRLRDIRAWLMSPVGYQRLEDTYHPDEFRLGIYKSGLEVEPIFYNKAGRFDIAFDCKPQRFLKSGEEEIDPSEWGETETKTGEIVSFEAESNTGIKSLVVGIEPNQSGSGDPSPDNVRPISGWDEVETMVSGKNLCDISDGETTTTQVNLGSVVVPSGTYTASAFLKRNDGGACRIYIKVGDGAQEGGSIVSGTSGGTSTYTFSVTEPTAVFFGVQFLSNYNTMHYSQFQLELGSTTTAYEPYNGQTINKSLGRTVYGGTLDLISGELVSGYSSPTVFNGNSTVYISATNVTGKHRYMFTGVLSIIKKPSSDNAKVGIYCDKLIEKTAVETYRATEGISVGTNGYIYVYIEECATMTIDEFKTWLNSNLLTICYPLATPQTYELTPEEVQTILGVNNIWADSGAVSVILTPYNVIYDEDNNRYYYLTDSGQEVTVTYAQLDKDSGGDPIKVIIGGLSNQISAVDKRLGGQIDGLDDKIGTLSSETSNTIGGLESRVSTNETTIGNQGDRLNTAEGELSNLHGIIVDKYEAFIDVQPSVPSITLGKRNDSAVRTRLEITDEVVNFYTDGKNSAKASGKSFESPEGKFEQITMKTVSGVGDLRWIARSNGHLSLKKITGDN